MIYLDNSATTYPKPECVYEALDYANRHLAFNAGRGQYQKAVEAENYILSARKAIASFVNCDFNCVTFLSSATETLNLIINGLNINTGDNVYISPFEHNAIIRPLYNLKDKINFNIFIIPFDEKTWFLDEEKLENMFAIHNPKTVLISSVSNVNGYKIPYDKIFQLSNKYNSVNILDCAQSFGVLPVDKDNVDFVIFAGHKTLYASFGIAGFINFNNIKLEITKSGGNGSDSLNHKMPENYYERYESGSANIVAIYGLLKSCEWLEKENILEKEIDNTQYLIKELKKLNNVILYLPKNENVLSIVSFTVKDYKPDEVATILNDEFGICVRSGYHCSPFVHDFIGTKDGGTVRVSLGAFNTKEDIDYLVDSLKSL